MPRTKKTPIQPQKSHVLPIAEKLEHALDAVESRIYEKLHGDPGLRRYLVGTAISVGVTLLIQTTTIFYWAGTITSRVGSLEKAVDRIEKRIDADQANK